MGWDGAGGGGRGGRGGTSAHIVGGGGQGATLSAARSPPLHQPQLPPPRPTPVRPPRARTVVDVDVDVQHAGVVLEQLQDAQHAVVDVAEAWWRWWWW